MLTSRTFLLSLLFLTGFFRGSAQTYNPSTCCTVSNKAYGAAQAVSTDGRSWFYDATNFVMRDYNGTTEVLSYLNLAKYRSGHFPIFVHNGGTLQSNGVWLGGTTLVYWFKDSTGSANLVRWYTDSTGLPGGPFYAIANNLSEGNAGLIKGNLALDLVNNTSDAQKNAAAVALTNHTIDGNNNTLLNIPNSALSHSTIGLTLNNTGATPQVTTTPAALGSSIALAVPYANASDSGFLRGTDWSIFKGKLDSVRISNDSVYNCVNGTCTLQSVIVGGGAVLSVSGTNASLLFSPTVGNVLGQVNPAFTYNWTGQHTFNSFAPIFSTLTTNGGIFYGSGSGQLLQSGAGTLGQIFQSQAGAGPIWFTPNATTVSGWLGYTPLSNALGNTHIFYGNGSNIATDVPAGQVAILNQTGLQTSANYNIDGDGTARTHIATGFQSLGGGLGWGFACIRSFSAGADARGFADQSVVDASAAIGYAAFDAAPQLFNTSSHSYDHLIGHQARPVFDASGATINYIYGFASYIASKHGTATMVVDYYADSLNSASSVVPTVTNHYQFYAEADQRATNSWGLYMNGLQPHHLNGMLRVGSDTTKKGNFAAQFTGANIWVNGIPIGGTGDGTNILLGNFADQAVTSGQYNMGIGTGALGSVSSGSRNVAIGHNAGLLNATGSFNISIGETADELATAGFQKTSIGDAACLSCGADTGITAIGTAAGYRPSHPQTGSYSTFIGFQSGKINDTVSKVTAIGYNAVAGIGNAIILGDTSFNPKIGMGTAYPTSKLDVRGQVRIVDGTQASGNVFTSDANGFGSWTSVNAVRNFPHTIFAPLTGGTVNLVNNEYNIINPAGAIAALTVNLPSTPSNNDVVYIKYTQAVTTVTYGNGTVVDGITAPTGGTLVVLTYDSGTTFWY